MGAYDAWKETLRVLSTRPRSEFLGDLRALQPFWLAVSGDKAAQRETAAAVFRAVQDVGEWWP